LSQRRPAAQSRRETAPLEKTAMPAQKGKDLLLKMHDGTGFATVAGLRAKTLAFNAQSVDVTNAESAGRWRELLAGAGVKRASVAGAGIFKDAASDALVRQAFFDGAVTECQVVIPDFGAVEGPFQISGLEFSGAHDGEVTFEIALESAGALTFAAA
jgi:TP901-1 family phage major tail protein